VKKDGSISPKNLFVGPEKKTLTPFTRVSLVDNTQANDFILGQMKKINDAIAGTLNAPFVTPALINKAKEHGHKTLLFFSGEELTGYLIFGPWQGHPFYIVQMAVSPEHQGEGIGTALIRELAEHALNSGINTITLDVKQNNPAVRFYDSLKGRIPQIEHVERAQLPGPYEDGSVGWRYVFHLMKPLADASPKHGSTTLLSFDPLAVLGVLFSIVALIKAYPIISLLIGIPLAFVIISVIFHPVRRIKVRLLTRKLKSEDLEERKFALQALGNIGPDAKEAVPLLINALEDTSSDVRRKAAEALDKFGALTTDLKVKRYIADLRDSDSAAIEALGKIGPGAISATTALEQKLNDPMDPTAGRAALKALENIGTLTQDHKRQRCIFGLKAGSRDICLEAVRLIKEVGDITYIDPLLDALKRYDNETYIGIGTVMKVGEPMFDGDKTVHDTELRTVEMVKRRKDAEFCIAVREALVSIGAACVLRLIEELEKPNYYSYRDSGDGKEFFIDTNHVDTIVEALNDIKSKPKESILALIEILEKEEWGTHPYALRVLGNMGSEAAMAIPYIIKASHHINGEVYEAAVKALCDIGPIHPDVISALKKVLQDHWVSYGVRQLAEDALNKFGVLTLNDRITRNITEIQTHDWTDKIRKEAKKELISLAYEINEEDILNRLLLIMQEAEVRNVAAERLEQLGKFTKDLRIEKHVMDVISSAHNPSALAIAINNLKEIDPEGGITIRCFINLLERQDPPFEYKHADVISALPLLGVIAKKTIPELLKILKNRVGKGRQAAAYALGDIVTDEKEAISILINAVEDKDPFVSSAAIRALGNIGSNAKDSIPILIKILEQEKNYYERFKEITKAIGKIGIYSKEEVSTLVKILKDDKDKLANVDIVKALAQNSLFVKDIIPIFIEALEDERRYVRKAVAKALGEIGPDVKEAVPALIKALGDSDSDVRTDAIEALVKIGAVRALINTLEDSNTDIRKAAIIALVKIGEPAVSALIGELGGDQNSAVHKAAIEALVKIGKPAVSELIMEAKDSYSHYMADAIEVLVKIGKPAVPEFIKVLGEEYSSDGDAYIAAIEALGKIGPDAKEAVLALIKVLGD
ncbi:MAG: GNAT family N-acetyltransferase, partial [Atribacterota bacterium]|nr:GNAT family N-acetyltransferase [Atribacterota bacterium]